MTEVTYHIVEHDGGFAYKVGDVFSEAFPSREDALQAAQAAAAEQQVPAFSMLATTFQAKGVAQNLLARRSRHWRIEANLRVRMNGR